MTTRRHDDSVLRLLNELSERPAMNGGFQKLASQQEEQCAQLESLDARLRPIEDKFVRLERWGKWVLGGIGAILVTVLGELLVNIITHLHITLN